MHHTQHFSVAIAIVESKKASDATVVGVGVGVGVGVVAAAAAAAVAVVAAIGFVPLVVEDVIFFVPAVLFLLGATDLFLRPFFQVLSSFFYFWLDALKKGSQSC